MTHTNGVSGLHPQLLERQRSHHIINEVSFEVEIAGGNMY